METGGEREAQIAALFGTLVDAMHRDLLLLASALMAQTSFDFCVMASEYHESAIVSLWESLSNFIEAMSQLELSEQDRRELTDKLLDFTARKEDALTQAYKDLFERVSVWGRELSKPENPR